MNREKYQEALNELKDLVHSELDGTKMISKYLVYCNTLQDLINQNKPLTLDECIKEWERLGYTGSIDKLRIHMYKQLFGVTTTLNIIHIFRSEDRRYDFNMDGYFTKEESILLTKTLKALEVHNDKEI